MSRLSSVPLDRHPAFAIHLSSSITRDLLILTKPRITLSMLVTALAASLNAMQTGVLPAHIPGRLFSLMGMMIGLGLVISSASAMNQWLERDTDRLFRRTRQRPLPAGRLAPAVALSLAFTLAPAGTWMLYRFAGLLSATIAVIAFFVYWAVYTPLKRVTRWAWIPGALAGATPPLVAWTAFAPPTSPTAWIFFAILFFWQIPHTVGLQWWQLDEYRRAGFPVILPQGASSSTRLATVVLPAFLLIGLSLLTAQPSLPGLLHGAICVALGAHFLRASLLFSTAPSESSGKNLFLASLGFVSGVFLALTFSSLT